MKNTALTIISLLLLANAAYSEVFTLEKAITAALENNESVLTARKELEKSEYVYNEAFSGALPKVEANLTYLRNIYSSKISNMQYYFAQMSNGLAGLNNTILDLHPESSLQEMSFQPMPPSEVDAMMNNTLKAEISLIQPIWLGGKVGTALKVAVIYRNMNQRAYELSKNTVITQIKKNFYQILALEESKRVMDMVRADAYKNLEKVEKMHIEGLVSEYDLIQAKVRVSSIEPKITGIENYLELSKEQLRINMGFSGEGEIIIDGRLTENISPDTLNAYNRAIENRLELILLEHKRELLEENISFQYSNHLPNIIGLANYTFQSQNNDLSDTFEKNSGVGAFNIGVTANFPIFNGFGTKAKVDQARVDEKKAVLEIQNTKRMIRLQVKSALSMIKLYGEELRLREREIAEYEKALEITQVRYDNGLCTQLELTGAQTALETARLNKVNTLHNYITAAIDLESAIGIITETEFN